MIIAGYPCCGKSSIAARNSNFIDLESSNFHTPGDKTKDWADRYAAVAKDLSKHHNVFISTHEAVLSCLLNYPDLILVFPSPELKQDWTMRAQMRWQQSLQNDVEKNRRAYERIRDHFDEDINALMNYQSSRIILSSMNVWIDDIIK